MKIKTIQVSYDNWKWMKLAKIEGDMYTMDDVITELIASFLKKHENSV